MDTLAVRLTLPTTKRVVDFHHQAIAHGGRTSIERRKKSASKEAHKKRAAPANQAWNGPFCYDAVQF